MKKYLIYIYLFLPLLGWSQLMPPSGDDCSDVDPNATKWFIDADGDGYHGLQFRCEVSRPNGYIAQGIFDCNDNNSSIGGFQTWYLDADGDGYGTSSTSKKFCSQPSGYVANANDCNDSDPTININKTWYRDADGDGYGISSNTTSSCSQPSGYVSIAGDCNDANASINPGAVEPCNKDSIDNNCNGQIDERSASTPTVSITKNCGNTVIQQGIHNLTSETWYWQSSATGTSTSNSSQSVTKTSNGTIYLRSRSNSSNCWGTAKQITYTVTTVPSVPTATVSDQCGKSILTRSNPPSGITWYWQSSSTGTSTTNSSSSITRTSGSTYYLRARNNTTGCWSSSRTVSYSIKAIPTTPSAPTVTNNCGNSVLTRSNPPSGITWYWQSSATGTSTANSSSSITRTSGSSYYLRARNNTTGCWSSSRTVSYSIKSVPSTPLAPSVTNNCGNSVLTRTSPLSNEITWYWQSSATGTSTANSSSSITRTSGSSYYLRARNNTTGCWSSSRTVSYSIKAVPATPSAPTVTNNCGNSVLTRSNPPSGITWYWQSSATGSSTANSSSSITRTSGSSYYLRARNNTTGCWSSSRTVSYSIKSVPATPLAPTVTNNCGNSVLTRTSPLSNEITWYWQSSATGTSTANSSSSITRTSGSTYYLRARNNTSLCWSAAAVVNYTVDPIPDWYLDADGDGFAISKVNQCSNPGTGYTLTVLPVTDCDDTDAAIHPNTLWYADEDEDGFGDPNRILTQCTQPTGYVINGDDQCIEDAGSIGGCPAGLYVTPTLTQTENYIYTRTYQREIKSSDSIKYNSDIIEGITYFDGLGRAKQQIGIKASPNQTDIVSHIEYDASGRQPKQYLPSERDTVIVGVYKQVDVLTDINNYYQDKYADDFIGITEVSDINAYSESIYEPSPLNRIVEQGAPGKDWKANPTTDDDHTIKFDWRANKLTDSVVRFKVDFVNGDTAQPQLVQDDIYIEDVLHISIIKDENWQPDQMHPNDHTTQDYKDKLGRVILKRTFNNNEKHDTYYVYDDFGNLTYVIPPKVTVEDGVSGSELAELCYQYKYDHRNRLVEKKIPGKDWEYIIYNKLDQPVFTQDANLKDEGWWLFTKYDVFGRIAYTGKYPFRGERQELVEIMEEEPASNFEHRSNEPIYIGGVQIYYSNTAFPYEDIEETEILTVNYYDDYELGDIVTFNPANGAGTWEEMTAVSNVKGLPTVTQVRVLGTDQWITTATYYDDKGRAWEIHIKNEYLGTEDWVMNKLDFTGKVLITYSTHTKAGKTITTTDTFTYDHMGRVLTQQQKINDRPTEQIAANTYDELGQLIQKNVGGEVSSIEATQSAGLQTVDYTYNIRGWLKGINDVTNLEDKLFGFKINYNNPQNGATALYNGNISETYWKTGNDNIQRHYKFEYDALNRLTSGLSNEHHYNLSYVTYDKMGNIQTLKRHGWQNGSDYWDMDILSYTYNNGNKLVKVSDGGNKNYGFKDGTNTNDDYTYDSNGNMITDANKGITDIRYNHLNLPELVTVASTEHNGNITYIYDATGAKLKKIVTEGSSLIETEYAGNYIYKNGQLEFMNHPEGYIEPNPNNTFSYIYEYKDHLGNIRLRYKDADQDGEISDYDEEILEEKNYYPFGLQHKGYNNTVLSEHNYGYNGKEEQEELGLNWIDYGFRNYDPAIGRWHNMDAHSELYFQVSPYNYAMNSPINFVDYMGLDPIYRNGKYYETNDDGEEYEVDFNYVFNWIQNNDGIAATYTFELNEDGNTRLIDTEKGDAGLSFNWEGKTYTANSYMTLMGRDDRRNNVGDFKDIQSLDENQILAIIGQASFVIHELYKGSVEQAMLGESLGGRLDYKTAAYDILGLNRRSLVEINGVVYNPNEAGNFLWGMVLEYNGGLVSPNLVAELGTRGRPDERWEQKAITAGRAYGVNLYNSMTNQMIEAVLRYRTDAAYEHHLSQKN